MYRVRAVWDAKEKSKEKRRGPGGQRAARDAERAIKVAAVTFRRWTADGGATREEVADVLGISDRTLERWEQDWEKTRLRAPHRGRKVKRSETELRNLVLTSLNLMGPHVGVPVLWPILKEHGMGRRELEDMVRRFKRLAWKKSRLDLYSLRWLVPGTVWAIDFHEPAEPVDGVYKAVLAVRDLASGKQLAWVPVADMTAETLISILRTLFATFGIPLVIKFDNGSAFISDLVGKLLAEQGIEKLLSPPGMPRYNGSCEAGIGSMKTRTDHQAALNDRPGRWTSDDCEAARRQADLTARPWGVRGPTPEERWNGRRAVTVEERERFRRLLEVCRRRVRADAGCLPGIPQTRTIEASLERKAVGRTLVACRLLRVRRRRITTPISRLFGANIS